MRAYDRGEATAQAVIAIPVVLLILWVGVQATVFLHGANVADAAANEGAAVAARYGSSLGAGERAIARTLSALDASTGGSWSLRQASGEVIAKVNLRLPRIVPFFPLTVTRTAHEPQERFMNESQR